MDCIVSSPPLLSLNERVRNQIISAMFEVLHEGGLLIQYTYSWRKANAFLKDGFRCIGSSQVWHNVPPARIFRFRREAGRVFGEDVKIGGGGGPFSRKGLPPPKPHPLPPQRLSSLSNPPCQRSLLVGCRCGGVLGIVQGHVLLGTHVQLWNVFYL